jgi:hypothetical protein
MRECANYLRQALGDREKETTEEAEPMAGTNTELNQLKESVSFSS